MNRWRERRERVCVRFLCVCVCSFVLVCRKRRRFRFTTEFIIQFMVLLPSWRQDNAPGVINNKKTQENRATRKQLYIIHTKRHARAAASREREDTTSFLGG